MLTLILVICIVVFIVSVVCLVQTQEEGWLGGVFVSALIGGCLLVAVAVGCVKLATSSKIDRQIEMCIEENNNIEQQITITVEHYLEHELNIYDSLQGQDITTLLVVYPEINGNELVKKQMEIFITNNDKIRSLKEQKLDLTTWKFLIYFGR